MLLWILVIVLLILAIGGFPTMPWHGGWGYAPSSVLVIILVIVLVFALAGHL